MRIGYGRWLTLSSAGHIVLLVRVLKGHALANHQCSGNNFKAGSENYFRCMPLVGYALDGTRPKLLSISL
jgi:hypothetical protein